MTTENNSKNEVKKKPKFKKQHLMIGGLVVALGVGSLAAYTAFKKDSKANTAPDELKVKRYEAIERDTIYDFSSGEMKITRNRVEDKSPATVCDDFLSGYKVNSIMKFYAQFAVALYDLTKLDDFLVEFNDVSKKTFELAAKDVKTIKKINKVATFSRVYQNNTNMDLGLYLDGLNKKVGIDTTRCRELLEQTIVRKVRGINVPNKAEEGTYNGKITENPDEVNTVYNTVYTKLGEETICLGENADAVYNEETGEFKSNFKGEWLILSDGQLLTTYYTGKLKDYDNGGNEEGDVYAILSEDEYSYAFIVEDASGHKMVSKMQEFSVKGQEIMLKTEEKENIQ
ncbi:MAG: hypothetical protein E7262_11225 [Lachnospiraceae bacterium]|nr:hypothetical protein [Lachnospiraceae bacterium]